MQCCSIAWAKGCLVSPELTYSVLRTRDQTVARQIRRVGLPEVRHSGEEGKRKKSHTNETYLHPR